MSNEKPILFRAPMVRAILDGSKTQTRRVVKFNSKYHRTFPEFRGGQGEYSHAEAWGWECGESGDHIYMTPQKTEPYVCPYHIGDELWVRETFCLEDTWEYHGDHQLPENVPVQYLNDGDMEWCLIPHYRATEPDALIMHPKWDDADQKTQKTIWKPSIFMPRWASRIQLKITDIRVERLQDISEEDASEEGSPFDVSDHKEIISNRVWFKQLWMSINKGTKMVDGYPVYTNSSWNDNPWVWVVEFERVEYILNGQA